MRCPNCGFDGLPGMGFCGMCGTRLALPCPDCGSANPLDYRFCGACGEPLVKSAVRGQPPVPSQLSSGLLPVSSSPAVRSATPPPIDPAREVRLEGERRQATVILADMRGSTDLAEKIGTEAWVVMMNRVFHILESEIYRYGGEVDQFRGDGLVAFFGTTVAHEDDPERAILASLAMQRTILAYATELVEQQGIDLRLRVGVNTGEVIVASIGDSTQHSEDTAMGRAIALAARMETAAEPGTVLVSENTYHLAASRFEWKSLGEITVKGLSQPIAVYRPLSPRTDALRSLPLETYGLSSLLVGRDKEFEALKGRVEDLRRGQGSVVLLTGEEGMGKSYLVSRVHQQALHDEALLTEMHPGDSVLRGLIWLRGTCRSYEQSWPYSMWRDMLWRWLGGRDEPGDETRDRLRRESKTLWGERADEHCPYLAVLLSLPLEEEVAVQVKGLDAESLRQRFFATLRSWVEAMARRGPIVLAFDDVYWADATSLALLEHCLPLCDREPVLFLIMFRLYRHSAIWEFHQRIERRSPYPHRVSALVLEPLTEAQSGEMIDQLIGAETLPTGTRAQIIEKAEGNPYYITEIVRSLIRSGVLVLDERTEQWQAAQVVDALDLPDTLRGLLLARIDDLSAQDRYVLQMAAVIGTVFWENVLCELVDPQRAPEQHLIALQQARLIQGRGRLPDLGLEYVFVSALIRDVAYDSVLAGQRAVYHRQVADHLAQLFGEEVLTRYYGVVAYHYRRAEEPRKELFYTLSAAEYAQGIYANAEAIEYYGRALELLDLLEVQGGQPRGGLWLDWRLESLNGLGKTYLGMGHVDEAEPYLRQAAVLAREADLSPAELVRLDYWLCEALFWLGRYEEQVRVAASGLALLGGDTESVEAALMNQQIALGHRASGRMVKYLEFTRRTAQFLERLPYLEELRPAYEHVASMYAFESKDVREAMRWLEVLEERATAHHDVRAVGQAYDYAGLILESTGDLHGARSSYGQALERYEQIGDAKHGIDVLDHLAGVSLALGELERTEQHVEQALQVGGVTIPKSSLARLHWRRCRVLACRHAWEGALDVSRESVRLFQEIGNSLHAAVSIHFQGLAHLNQGEKAAALGRFEEAVAVAGSRTFALDPRRTMSLLSAAERASANVGEFRAFCRRLYDQIPDSFLVQWFLEPGNARSFDHMPLHHDRFVDALSPDWAWCDPFDDCVLRVQGGLRISAANGRDLQRINLSAPRVVRPAGCEWAAETVCVPVSNEQPSVGGLLAWADNRNYLCLVWGISGGSSVTFMGCLDNQDVLVGRGHLGESPHVARVFLRMERVGERVSALCSADGSAWFTVGEVSLLSGGSIEVGLCAIGNIDRTVYPGAYRDGTAIRFESFRLWGSMAKEG